MEAGAWGVIRVQMILGFLVLSSSSRAVRVQIAFWLEGAWRVKVVSNLQQPEQRVLPLGNPILNFFGFTRNQQSLGFVSGFLPGCAGWVVHTSYVSLKDVSCYIRSMLGDPFPWRLCTTLIRPIGTQKTKRERERESLQEPP